MSEPELSLLDGVAWRAHAVPAGRGQTLLAALALSAPQERAGERPRRAGVVRRRAGASREGAAGAGLPGAFPDRCRRRLPRGQRVPTRPARGPGRPPSPATAGRRRACRAHGRRPRRRAAPGATGPRPARHDRRRRRAPRRGRHPRPHGAGTGAAAARGGAAGPWRRQRSPAPARGEPGRQPGRRGLPGRRAARRGAGARRAGGPGAVRVVRRTHPRGARCLTRAGPGTPACGPAGPRGAGAPGAEVRRDAAGRPRRRRGPHPRPARGLARRLDRGTRRPREDPDGTPGGAPVGAARGALRGARRRHRGRRGAARGGGRTRRAGVGDERAHRAAARRPPGPGGRAALGAADVADPRQLRAPRGRGGRPRRLPGRHHRRDPRAHHDRVPRWGSPRRRSTCCRSSAVRMPSSSSSSARGRRGPTRGSTPTR